MVGSNVVGKIIIKYIIPIAVLKFGTILNINNNI